MSEREVLRADVLEGLEGEEVPEKPSRRLTAGPIIAIMIVLVILTGAGFYFFWGTSVTSVRFLNEPLEVSDTEGRYGVALSMLALSRGAQTVDGKGALDISFNSARVHTQQVTVKEDRADVTVMFSDFVTENGDYEFTFSMDGKRASSTHRIGHVPVSINLSVTVGQDNVTGATRHYVLVTPKFSDTWTTDLSDYSKRYSVEIGMLDPTGEDAPTTMSLYDLLLDPYSPELEIEGDYMGYYTISALMENTLVKSTSMYRQITSEPTTLDVFVNRAPIINEFRAPERARKGVEVEFIISASDPDLNGGIDYLLIDWDVQNNADDFQEFQDYSGGVLRVKHTFQQTKTFIVYFTVGDNGDIDPGNGEPPQKRFFYKQVTVQVTLL